MVAHVPIRVHLTKAQAVKLRRGHNVRVAHTRLRGPHVLHVTMKTARRHRRAVSAGTGMIIAHHAVAGGSLSSLFSGLAQAIKPVASQALRQYALPAAEKFLSQKFHPLAGRAASALGSFGLSKLGLGRRRVVSRARSVGCGRSRVGSRARSVGCGRSRRMSTHHRRARSVSANPFRAPRLRGFSRGVPAMVQGVGRRRRMMGGSFFGDLWNGVKSVGRVAAPLLSLVPHPGAQVASRVISGLTGEGRRRAGSRRVSMTRRAVALRNLAKARAARGMGSRRSVRASGLYGSRGRGLFP